MGLSVMKGKDEQAGVPSGEDCRRARFGDYFPRLFAYVRPKVGDDSLATEIVVESFTRVFAYRASLDDAEFPVVLFGLARDLCRERQSAAGDRPEGGLSAREQDVVALLFDARLNRREVGCLLRMDERTVTATLVQALKKLRATPAISSAPSFLRS